MRKFKLRDQVARKLRGTENTAFTERSPETAAERKEDRSAPGLRIISRTDIGLIRKSNQDALILGASLFGVADGMGGHNGGETASAGARDGLLSAAFAAEASPQKLEQMIEKVNLELWERQLQDETLSGMGTTLTVLWPTEEEMLIGHVGDSRAYLWRGGELRQVTEDHSMVADMVRRGLLSEEEAACHPMRNYITRAVGTENTISPDILSIPREKGDRWLICSDGLHGTVSRDRLCQLMSAEDLEESADQMIREALDRGGRDNITLIIAQDLTERNAFLPLAGGAVFADDSAENEKTRVPDLIPPKSSQTEVSE